MRAVGVLIELKSSREHIALSPYSCMSTGGNKNDYLLMANTW